MAKDPKRRDEWSGSIEADMIFEWYDGELVAAELPDETGAEAIVGDTVLVRLRDGAPGTEGYFGRGRIVERPSETTATLKPLEMFDSRR